MCSGEGGAEGKLPPQTDVDQTNLITWQKDKDGEQVDIWSCKFSLGACSQTPIDVLHAHPKH